MWDRQATGATTSLTVSENAIVDGQKMAVTVHEKFGNASYADTNG